MLTLISRWRLRNGCSPGLLMALEKMAAQIRASEPGTLSYWVHLGAGSPLDADGQPRIPAVAPISLEQQVELTFVETYTDADAFASHVNGAVFTSFRQQQLANFYEDPQRPGWPLTETQFYDRRFTVGETDAS